MAVQPSWKIIDTEASRKGGVFTATVVWELRTPITPLYTEMLADAVVGLFLDVLPIEGTPYPTFPKATCREVTAKRIEGGIVTYTAQFSDANAKDSAATSENPLQDLPIIRPVASIKDRAIHKDRDDKAMLNAAGDPILQSIDDNLISISVETNVSEEDNIEALVIRLRNTTNAAPFQCGRWYCDTNIARVIFPSDFLSEPKKRNDTTYYVFKYELSIDERDKHYGVPLNAGFRRLNVVSLDPFIEEKVKILAKDGSEPDEPVPLTEEGDVIEDVTPENVNYLEFKKYREDDYTLLPGCQAWSGPA